MAEMEKKCTSLLECPSSLETIDLEECCIDELEALYKKYMWCESCERYMIFLRNYAALFIAKDETEGTDEITDVDVIKEEIHNIKKDILWIKSRLK